MKIEITAADLFELKQLQERLHAESRLEHRKAVDADERNRRKCGHYEGERYTERERELGHNLCVLDKIIRVAVVTRW